MVLSPQLYPFGPSETLIQREFRCLLFVTVIEGGSVLTVIEGGSMPSGPSWYPVALSIACRCLSRSRGVPSAHQSGKAYGCTMSP